MLDKIADKTAWAISWSAVGFMALAVVPMMIGAKLMILVNIIDSRSER